MLLISSDFYPRFVAEGSHRAVRWAFAKLQHHEPQLLEALIEQALQRCGHFQVQGLANISWACGTLRIGDPRLLDALAQQATTRMGDLQPQHLSNMAWAFAKLLYMNDGFQEPREPASRSIWL